MKRVDVVLLALLTLLASAPTVSRAQPTRDPLLRARAALRGYDLEGPRTVEVVASLSELARAPEPDRAREARFLRAIATTDLWLLTEPADPHALRARLAVAWGLEPDALLPAVRRELAALRVGPYDETAADALAALADDTPRVLPSEAASHTRRQVAFLLALPARLAADPLEALASSVEDPCPSECEPPYAHFGPLGRRAIATMGRVFDLVRAVERVSSLGDPVATIFRQRHRAPLDATTLAPPDWGGVIAASPGTEGRAVEADAVIVVAAEQVRVGWVPTVRWDADRRPQAVASSEHVLGSAREVRVRIGADVTSSSRLEPLLGALQAHFGGARRVVLVAEPGAEGRVMASVLRTLHGTPHAPTVVATSGADGRVRGVPVESVAIGESSGDEALRILVRPGGLTVTRRGDSTSIPRMRVDGRWQLDLDTLAQAIRGGSERQVRLRFMPATDASMVVRTAITATAGGATLVLAP